MSARAWIARKDGQWSAEAKAARAAAKRKRALWRAQNVAARLTGGSTPETIKAVDGSDQTSQSQPMNLGAGFIGDQTGPGSS